MLAIFVIVLVVAAIFGIHAAIIVGAIMVGLFVVGLAFIGDPMDPRRYGQPHPLILSGQNFRRNAADGSVQWGDFLGNDSRLWSLVMGYGERTGHRTSFRSFLRTAIQVLWGAAIITSPLVIFGVVDSVAPRYDLLCVELETIAIAALLIGRVWVRKIKGSRPASQ